MIAPEHPGAGTSQGLEHVEDIWDLVLYYAELFDALELRRAAPSSATRSAAWSPPRSRRRSPERVGKLVLIAPIGLWRDDHPVPDISGMPFENLVGLLFADPS